MQWHIGSSQLSIPFSCLKHSLWNSLFCAIMEWFPHSSFYQLLSGSQNASSKGQQFKMRKQNLDQACMNLCLFCKHCTPTYWASPDYPDDYYHLHGFSSAPISLMERMTKQLEALTLRQWSTQAVLPSAMHHSQLQGFLVFPFYNILVLVWAQILFQILLY